MSRSSSPIATAARCTSADVADVTDDVENARQAAWMNETPAVLVNIQRQPGANVIEVVRPHQEAPTAIAEHPALLGAGDAS